MLLWIVERWMASGGSFWVDHLAAASKITFRGAWAALAAFFLAVLLGPCWIGWLRARFREPIKGDSPDLCRLHSTKQATPTMGGLFLVAALVAGALAFGDLGNRYVQAALVTTAGLAAVGAADDLVKLRTSRNGLSRRAKLLCQTAAALPAAWMVYLEHAGTADGLGLGFPGAGQTGFLGAAFMPLALLVIVGTSNAVNLTDGLDGLAAGCLIFAVAAMGLAAYAAGHAEWAAYLGIPRIPAAGEVAVLAACAVGGLLGFLWFNCHPAEVFMGDTGALPLGGLLGLLAVVARQEILLVVVGGVFVAEAASVALQISCHRLRGRRIFLCAPLHHHFQFRGWPETRIVARFWIAAALCAVLGMGGLKALAPPPPAASSSVTVSSTEWAPQPPTSP